MYVRELHRWPQGHHEAVRIQHQYKDKIIIDGPPEGVHLIAGVDTAFNHVTNILSAAVCLFSFPEMIERERAVAWAPATFPYVPGLHAFREGPVILGAFQNLKVSPDLVIFAGHGISHPRRFGLACHLGLILDLPAIGCARKVLAGEYGDVGPLRGASAPLLIDGQQVGVVYRSRDHVKPIFISPGHRCRLTDAVNIVVRCLGDYRVPEPLRAAHRLANKIKHGRMQHHE